MKKKKNIRKHETEVKPAPGFGKETINRITDLAQTLCESEEMELVHVEYQNEPGGRILRVFIDKPGGVGLNDCVHISRQLGDLLDVYIESDIPYHLEVSSPGLERPLGKKDDFNRFKGNSAKIRTRHAVDGRKNFTGTLLGITEGAVKLEKNDGIVAIPYEEILKARLVNHNGE
ncbi:MAG: ribosome maturation factor RimP [Desulfobacterales bacterium]